MFIFNKQCFITIHVFCFELNKLEGQILHTVFNGNDK